MKLLNKIPPMGKKGTVAGLVICFVAMIALVGTYTVTKYQGSQQEQVADNNKLESKEKNLLENDNDNNTDDGSENQGANEQANNGEGRLTDDETQEANTDNIINDMDATLLEEVGTEDETQSVDTVPIEDEEVAGHVAAHFDDGDSLTWPINGGVIMKYNMEQTVYFETLDQYKRNPAMIIDGEVGDAVVAAAAGVVSKVETDRETGQTVTIDMGNGYEAVYGQLEGISVNEGVYVEEGESIGILAEPTKYYSVEGCNLYFKLSKEGNTVDPLEYLE